MNLLKKRLKPWRKLIYRLGGKKPWSYGYNDARWELIANSIRQPNLLDGFRTGNIPAGFGIGFDERVVEYPWIFSRLNQNGKTCLLDAGSTLNFEPLIHHNSIASKELTIYTYYPEPVNFVPERVSYLFGDLRRIPLRDEQFEEIICQSTIEHIDMDNSIYGYDMDRNQEVQQKSYEYLKVIDELLRLLKPGGRLLLTFPYGIFENHGFFQQFDAEMVERISQSMKLQGNLTQDYLLYAPTGWHFASVESCNKSTSYNPHTGKGKGHDGAAHCRCVCCITFIKNER